MRRTPSPSIAPALLFVVSSLLAACGGGGAGGGNQAPDTTVRPAGTGWFCHGEENAAFCARTMDECEALRTSTQADPAVHPCTARPQAHCFTFQHPTVGTHYRCFDSAVHCENSRGRCTEDETCSVCDSWD